ncbi:hypothetical protein HGA91_06600 [candidate division WWE3 bacterium]|nr:hypothetical protein [candidate division WWE3 bacterium]
MDIRTFRQSMSAVCNDLNLIFQILGLRFELLDSSCTEIQHEIIALETKAYVESGISADIEGIRYLENIYRKSTPSTEVIHVGIRECKQNRLIAYFAVFQTRCFLFNESTLAWLMHDYDVSSIPPIMVFTKLMRDPDYRKLIARSACLRVALGYTVASIASREPRGILLEMRAQPDTQAMLRPEILNLLFRDYEYLMKISEPESPAARLLIYIKSMRRSIDKAFFITGLIRLAIRGHKLKHQDRRQRSYGESVVAEK